MPLPRSFLLATKRQLIAARIAVQDCTASAWRAGDTALASRLRAIAGKLAEELDYIESLLSKQP